MPKTGETAQTSGIYEGNCIPKGHKKQIALSKGERFPPCGDCHGPVTWTLKQPTK